MNNTIETTEYEAEDSDMVAFLNKAGAAIKPSEASFRAMLSKIPAAAPVVSPYAPKKSPFAGYWWKAAVTMLAIVLLIGGGTVYFDKGAAPSATSGSPMAMTSSNSDGTVVPVASPNQVAMTSAADDTPVIASGDDDQSLAEDEQSIDGAMSTLDADNTSADQSLQDSQS